LDLNHKHRPGITCFRDPIPRLNFRVGSRQLICSHYEPRSWVTAWEWRMVNVGLCKRTKHWLIISRR